MRLARLVRILEPIAHVLEPLVEDSGANNLRIPELQRSQ